MNWQIMVNLLTVIMKMWIVDRIYGGVVFIRVIRRGVVVGTALVVMRWVVKTMAIKTIRVIRVI